MQEREPKTVKTNVDLTIPVDIEKHKVSTGCFGKMWDIATKECSRCADNELCGILMREVVDKRAEAVEQQLGSTFLDKADFSLISVPTLMSYIEQWENGTMPVKELLDCVMRVAQTSDQVAAVEWIKRFVREQKLITTKGGTVWLTKGY